MQENLDVLIVGAGIAGLVAAAELAGHGKSVLIVEARERIGGRIWTIQNQASGPAIELGAEFVHGLSPEIWETLQASHIEVMEIEGDSWCKNGRLAPCNFFGQ